MRLLTALNLGGDFRERGGQFPTLNQSDVFGRCSCHPGPKLRLGSILRRAVENIETRTIGRSPTPGSLLGSEADQSGGHDGQGGFIVLPDDQQIGAALWSKNGRGRILNRQRLS